MSAIRKAMAAATERLRAEYPAGCPSARIIGEYLRRELRQ